MASYVVFRFYAILLSRSACLCGRVFEAPFLFDFAFYDLHFRSVFLFFISPSDKNDNVVVVSTDMKWEKERRRDKRQETRANAGPWLRAESETQIDTTSDIVSVKHKTQTRGSNKHDDDDELKRAG